MKVKYDQAVDVLRIRFSSASVDESDEEKLADYLKKQRDDHGHGWNGTFDKLEKYLVE
jgi:hypothetical protein